MCMVFLLSVPSYYILMNVHKKCPFWWLIIYVCLLSLLPCWSVDLSENM